MGELDIADFLGPFPILPTSTSPGFHPPKRPSPSPLLGAEPRSHVGSSSFPPEGLGRRLELEDPRQALSLAHAQSDSTNPSQVTSQVMVGALLMSPFHP